MHERLKSKSVSEKKSQKTSARVPRRPAGYFADALKREDINEINLFSRMIARRNARRS